MRTATQQDDAVWLALSARMFQAAWAFSAGMGCLLLALIWSGDVRFLWTALLLVVPMLILTITADIIRAKHDGLDGPLARAREYRGRVKRRRPSCVAISLLLLLAAMLCWISAIWLTGPPVAWTGAVAAGYAVAVFLFGVSWDD